MLEKGIIDWNDVFSAISEIDYKGYVNAETSFDDKDLEGSVALAVRLMKKYTDKFNIG